MSISATANAAIIQLSDLSFTRPNGAVCAKALDFALNANEKVSISGANGSGKSTLLALTMGLLPSCQRYRGEIKLFGHLCRTEKDFNKYRAQLGLVFQDPDDQLFSPTVLDDVCFGPRNLGLNARQAKERALEVLDRLNIVHLADQVSFKLSGGQKRLVALASVLAMKPKALLLDEPTNGLDADSRALLIDYLQGTDLALLLISHDVELRKALVSKEYRLENGQLTLDCQQIPLCDRPGHGHGQCLRNPNGHCHELCHQTNAVGM